MIQAKELRVGNLVRMFLGVTDSGAEYSEFYFELNHFNYLARLEPIPITEEWLLKLGFIEDSFEYIKIISPDGLLGIRLNPYDVDFKEIGVCIFQKDDIGITEEHENHYVFLDSIKYIHQLQNLYFALTGKELEYVVKD